MDVDDYYQKHKPNRHNIADHHHHHDQIDMPIQLSSFLPMSIDQTNQYNVHENNLSIASSKSPFVSKSVLMFRSLSVNPIPSRVSNFFLYRSSGFRVSITPRGTV